MIKRNLTCKIFCLAVVLSFSVLSISAADRYSVATGNWNATSTWSASSGGGSGASVPVAGDNVFIENGYTVTITANASCSNITFTGTGASATLTVNSTFTLTVSGTVTLDNLASNNSAGTFSGAGSLSCADVAVGSAVNLPTSNNTTFSHTITSRIAFLNITNNLTINSYYRNSNRIRNGVFNLESGIVSTGGSVTTINADASNISTFSMTTGAQSGTLIITGAPTFNLSGTGTNTISLNGTSSLVNYNRVGAQTAFGTSYTNLTLSGGGAKTITGVTVNGIMSLEGTATATGTAATYGAASTLQYKGSASQTTGIEFPATFSGSGGVIINNIAGVTLSGSAIVTGTVTLTSGTFAVGANTLTLNGPAIAGTPGNLLTTAASSLSFGGSSAGVSIPASIASLNNLTINNANGVTLNSNITLAAGGVLTLTNGILQAGTNILKVTNSNPASVLVASQSTFVNVTSGGVERTLLPNLAGAGNNYLFPIGEGGAFKGINLRDVNTGSTGPVLRAGVSATGALTGDGTTIGPVDPRYWSLINLNSGDLTSFKLELYESGLDFSKTVGMSLSAGGNYSAIGGSSNTSSIISLAVINPAPYFCIGTSILNTYYSYQTGDWNTSSTWTSDPSGTLQVGSTIPGINDKVIILTGRTVSLSSDIITQGLDITIDEGGFLDQTDKRFTNPLAALSGKGTIKLASVNFPATITNSFINSGGGTTEYNNTTNFTLPASQTTYNNLTINTSGFTATQLSNITLNGNLYVKTGTFQINNNISIVKLNLTINGNVTVENGAFITVGNGVTNTAIGGAGGVAPFLTYYLNFHTVIVKGNFTNNGTVKFTNLPYPVYNAFPPIVPGPTSGAASVYFQGASDNVLNCNGITNFYNLILDKGTDQTFKLTINSTNYSNFRLFGANVSATDGAVTGDPNLRKALWIRTGTLILKGMVIIPSLSEGIAADSDYYIPSKGALIVDGVDVVIISTADDYKEINIAYSVASPDNATIGVIKGGFSAMDIFGKLQLNSGYLSTRESGGLITSNVASGQIIINGGTIDSKQLLSSTGSASFTQTGGIFILRGRFQRTPAAYSTVADLTDVSIASLNTSRATNGISSGFGSFNLEQPANIFTMSGGTIRIYDVCGIAVGELEALDVKSSTSNINVSGGTVEIRPVTGTVLADAANYLINTSAPLFNMLIDRASSTSVVQLNTSPLVVLNDLTLASGDFSANNLNVTIGGDFSVAVGTSYSPGTNITTFNGTGDQTFTVNLAVPLSLYKLTIDKPAGVKVDLAGSQNTLNINDNFRLVLGTLNDNGKTINITRDVYNSGLHSGTGKIVLNGILTQSIAGNGVFENVELNNTNALAAPVSLAANMTLNGVLTFSQNKLLNINTFNLKLNAAASIVNASVTRYIQTSGNAGDGGVTKVFASTAPFTFPLGAPTITPVRPVKYAPATIGFTAAPAVYGSITIVPVGYEHPSTTVDGQSLTYFWRIKSSGFSGIAANSVTHSFVYNQSDVVGTENNYIPALYTSTDFTWRTGTNANPPIDITNNLISDWTTPTNSSGFLDADYTAGDAAFGTPRTFYSIASSAWNVNSTWSYTSGGPVVPAGAVEGVNFPGPNSIVIIENNRTVNLTANQRCASLQIQSGSTLDIYTWTGSIFSMVLSHPSGNNGLFRLTTTVGSPKVFSFPANSDFSDFNNNRGTTEFYDIDGATGAEYILPPNVNTYGNLILRAKGGDNLILPNNSYTTIKGDLTCTGDNPNAWVTMSWLTAVVYNPTVEKTVRVTGNMFINNGTFLFLDDQTPQHLIVDGNVTIAPGAIFDVYNNYPVNNGGAPRLNSFEIGGSFINNSNINPSARFISGSNYVNLTFSGSTNASITSGGGSTPNTIFNKVIINKGSSQATTLTINIAGTLTTPLNNWLTLQNGTLIYNRTGNFYISQGTDFIIPSTSGLTINTPSDVFIANSATNNKTLFLNGKLTVMTGGGNVYLGPIGNTANNADIEYSGSGASAIEVQGGNLVVNGQIRRPNATTNGILSYKQSGGSVTINGNNPLVTKAKLEVLNDGSDFTMSGGTLIIVRGGGTTFGDLYLRPSASSVTGGTIIFSNNINGINQTYGLEANISLNNLTITGRTAATAADATVGLMISPLVLKGSLTLTNNRSFLNSNNINVSLKGDLNNSGTYNFGTNLTTFNGGVQAITGTSITNFYNLNVSPATSLSVNNDFNVSKNLTIGNGNLVLVSRSVSLLGDLINNGSYTDNNTTGGISLSGSAQQQITGTGAYGRLTLNNPSGARLNNDITLQNNLVLSLGVLDINRYLLTLSQNSSISGAPFNVTKMIISDGVISSFGVRKYLTTGPQSFTFPVGVNGKYTPAFYIISVSSTIGYVKVNPINSPHPSVTDPSNALNYYWQVESSGISGFDANVLFQYVQADVQGVESDYVAAKLEFPGNYWYEAPPGPGTDNVDETNHQITFIHTASSNLNGEYTAGKDIAIPGEVPTYQSNSDGNWSDLSIWTPVGSSPPTPTGGPSGANVIIDHVVTTDINRRIAYTTTINNRLRIVSPTFGHNLGIVSGNGTIYLENGNLPGGNYTAFVDCSGNGAIEYGGTGTYTIIATLFNSLPNMLVTGTGTRILPNKDLTICKRLIIDGPSLDNSVNNRKLLILGTIERYNTGAFISGSGASPASTVSFAGTGIQTLGGPTGDFTGANKFNNLEINNPAGLNIGVNGLVEVNNELLLTNGIINSTSANKLILLNTSPAAVLPDGGSATSFVNGPLIKQIVNGGSFLYPIGKGTIKGHNFTLTSSAGSTLSWTAEYFTPNSTATSLTAPLQVSNTMEYWSVTTSIVTTAKVKIGWDPLSVLTPLMTVNGIADMRVAEYNAGSWNELTSTTSGDNNNGDVATTNNVSISTIPSNYTTASITQTVARASLGSAGPICGTAGILVQFTSFSPINLNYTLNFTYNGAAQPIINVTSLPYTLPTPVPGAYKLTGFTYNNGANTGVVDGTTVNVYANPQASNAGSDQSLCSVSGTVLAGNNPAPYSGLWTIVSGAGGTIINSTLFNSVFTGVLGETYRLRWTISNFSCTSSDEVDISFPVVASIPSNFTSAPTPVCQGSGGHVYTVLNVSGNTYNWSYSGTGHTINGTGNSVTIDFNSVATSGTLSVTATNSCGTSAPRTVNITVNALPVAAFSYIGTPFCQNAVNPSPTFSGGGVAGTFSSTVGLVFVSTATGQVNLAASTPGSYIVTNTIAAAAGCGIVTATSPIAIIADLVWTGAVSTDWNVPGNWSCGFIPNLTTLVQIPNVANKPVLSTGAMGTVNNLIIDNSSSLTIAGNTIQISGTITNNGTFTTTTGIVEMNGTVPQSIGANIFAGNTIKDLIINNPAGVTLQGPLNITGIVNAINGTLSSGGNLTLLSSVTETALIDGSGTGNITGSLTMQRYLPSGFGYKYFSSPFQTATVGEFGDDMNLAALFPSVYRYDESRTSSGWVSYINPLGILNPMQGYAINFGSLAAANTADITGIVNNGNLSLTIYNNNNTYTKGFNLVGNPYPSPINWDAAAGWTKTNIDNALYYFKASTTDQYGGIYSTYINGVSSDGSATSIIPSMQGFFVHVSDGAWPVTGTLSLNNSVRVTDLTHSFIKSGGTDSKPLLRLTTSFSDDPASADPVVIYFDEKASSDFDSKLDALKLMNTDLNVANLYAVGSDGAKLSINALPPISDNLCKVPLGLKINRDGYISFRIRNVEEKLAEMKIYLSDLVTGTEQVLLPDKEYKLYLTFGEYKNRFFLNMGSVSTEIPDVQPDNELFTIYSSHGILKVEINSLPGENGNFMIYNLTGQTVFVAKVFEPGYYEFNPEIKDGIYIVSFISGTRRSSKKIFILNK